MVMKEKLLLVGSGGFGRVTLEHAMKVYDCYFVDDGYVIGNEICGAQVVGHTYDLLNLFSDYKQLVVTMGNNAFREKIYKEAEKIGYVFPNIICESVYISPFAKIGNGCVILNNVTIQNGSTVGNGVVLNPGVEIHHDSIIEDYALIYANSVVGTMAKVGTRAKLGSNVTISNNIVVNDDAVIDNGVSLL
jgi:sugar O-acyltransferase (sialic acid O-acetyltransferase NeuD family)